MPGMYAEGEYDVAGFAVGAVEKSAIVDGRSIASGAGVLGLASSGAHSNGYSLVRRILERAKPELKGDFHGRALGDVLIEPTRIYAKPLLALMREVKVKGMAHITGGGLIENVPRVLPEDVKAVISRSAWSVPPLFQWLQREGGVADAEMHRVFNCGIGMVVVVAAGHAAAATKLLVAQGETVYHIGAIEARKSGEPQAVID